MKPCRHLIPPIGLRYERSSSCRRAIFLFCSTVYRLFSGALRNGLPMDVREKLEVAASARLPMTLFVPMVLIWPILGAFNFMLPVYVSNHGWTLFELGVLDAVFGLGMALIGVLVIIANTGRNLLVYLSALTALSVISTTMWWVMPDTLFLKALSLLILGMAFGGARVHIRVAIACRLRSVLAG